MVLETIPLETPVLADLRMEKILLAKANDLETSLTAVLNEIFLSSPGLQPVSGTAPRACQLSSVEYLEDHCLMTGLGLMPSLLDARSFAH